MTLAGNAGFFTGLTNSGYGERLAGFKASPRADTTAGSTCSPAVVAGDGRVVSLAEPVQTH